MFPFCHWQHLELKKTQQQTTNKKQLACWDLQPVAEDHAAGVNVSYWCYREITEVTFRLHYSQCYREQKLLAMRIGYPCKYLICKARGTLATVNSHEDLILFKYSHYFFCVLLRNFKKFNSIMMRLRKFAESNSVIVCIVKCLKNFWPGLTLPNKAYAKIRNCHKHLQELAWSWPRCFGE